MKLQIDFDKQTIKVEDNVSLGKLIETIEKMIPDWKEWKLETNVTINWSNPIVIEKYRPYRNPFTWYGEPTLCSDKTTNYSSSPISSVGFIAEKCGVINLELDDN